MSEWKSYRRIGWIEARPYVPGEDMTHVSVSEEDMMRSSLEGGMIARNPNKIRDQWYIAPDFFHRHYASDQLNE